MDRTSVCSFTTFTVRCCRASPWLVYAVNGHQSSAAPLQALRPPTRRRGLADVCNRKAQMRHRNDGTTDWCRMTVSFWDSGLQALLFRNALSRVDCLFAQWRRECFVWLRLFPRALSFPHRVSSTNIISFRQLLLYFNPTSSFGITSPLSVQMSRTLLDPQMPRGANDAKDSTPALQVCSLGSHAALILLRVGPVEGNFSFSAAATSWFSYLKKTKQKSNASV